MGLTRPLVRGDAPCEHPPRAADGRAESALPTEGVTDDLSAPPPPQPSVEGAHSFTAHVRPKVAPGPTAMHHSSIRCARARCGRSTSHRALGPGATTTACRHRGLLAVWIAPWLGR